MARRQHMTVRFPVGADDNADPALLVDSRAAVMIGISQINPGQGARTWWKKRVQLDSSFAPSGRICGVFQYTGLTAADDIYVIFKDGAWYKCDISANAPTTTVNALNFTSTQLVAIPDLSGITFADDKRIRAVQQESEMFFVQEGGVLPVRFNGTSIYKLGIDTPATPTDGGNLAGGPLVVGATYLWAVTYEDALGRESSPSSNVAIVMGAGGGRTINWTAPSDAQVQRIYLYRSVALPPGSTASTLYRVVEGGFSAGTTTWGDNAINDTLIQFNTIAPLPGQNDPPVAASLISAYKNRLALNSTENPRELQISNLQEPGSYSQLGALYTPNGQLLNATDGQTANVLNEFGDEITALGYIGSVLAVWNRRTTAVYEGDTPQQYQLRIVPHSVGCIAPDSVQACGNVTCFMSEDGVYALDYQSGFGVYKISGDYDNFFRSASVLWDPPGEWPPSQSFGRQQRAEAAVSCFLQNRYCLVSPPYSYIFDFDTKGQSLDYLVGMPYDDESGDSNGYMCMSRVFADRQYEVALFSPGIGDGTPIGDLYCMSYYPLVQTDVGVPEPFSFVYELRAIDGAGVARNRLKRMVKVTVYGTLEPMVTANGTPTANPLLQGTISLVMENGQRTVGPFYFDNIQQSGTDFVGAYFPLNQTRGIVIQQGWPIDTVGYIMQVLIQGTTVNGIFTMSDCKCEYDVLDGSN